MYLPPKDTKNKYPAKGFSGLPEHYPTPKEPNMLFYIQRNQNPNTVIYQVNLGCDGNLIEDQPIYVYWKQYDNNGKDKPLNYIQRKLAYGYESVQINKDTYQLNIISYPKFKMFLTRDGNNAYKIVGKINNVWSELSNVYVFAEEGGAFPVVKYLEIYGHVIDSRMPCYQKIDIL